MDIIELRLNTTELKSQHNFYAGTLGLPVLENSADRLALQIGESRLVFEAGHARPYHYAVNVPGNQFTEAKQWLAARVPLMPMPDGTDEVDWRGWNAHAVYFQDAAGNIGELIARHNLPGRDAPFGVQGWQRISEIGLAVDDVAQAAHSLDMPVFEPGDGENFTALGDDLGLLIIVKQGRAWFPTADCYAQPDPVDVVVNSPVQSTMTVPGGPYRITYTQREMI